MRETFTRYALLTTVVCVLHLQSDGVAQVDCSFQRPVCKQHIDIFTITLALTSYMWHI